MLINFFLKKNAKKPFNKINQTKLLKKKIFKNFKNFFLLLNFRCIHLQDEE